MPESVDWKGASRLSPTGRGRGGRGGVMLLMPRGASAPTRIGIWFSSSLGSSICGGGGSGRSFIGGVASSGGVMS